MPSLPTWLPTSRPALKQTSKSSAFIHTWAPSSPCERLCVMASLEFQRNLKNRIELSVVKWGKHSTRVWSYTGKKYISIQGSWNAQQTINFGSKLSFIIHLVFPFSWAPPLLLDTFWLLLPIWLLEIYSRTFCIKCWVSGFHTEICNKIFLLCIYIPLKEGIEIIGRGVKGGPKTGWLLQLTLIGTQQRIKVIGVLTCYIVCSSLVWHVQLRYTFCKGSFF